MFAVKILKKLPFNLFCLWEFILTLSIPVGDYLLLKIIFLTFPKLELDISPNGEMPFSGVKGTL